MTAPLWVLVAAAVVCLSLALWWAWLERAPRLLPEQAATEPDVLTLIAAHARGCSRGTAETKALLSHYVTRVDRDHDLAAYVRLEALGPHVADHLRYYLASEEFRARLVLVMREEWRRPPATDVTPGTTVQITGQHVRGTLTHGRADDAVPLGTAPRPKAAKRRPR